MQVQFIIFIIDMMSIGPTRFNVKNAEYLFKSFDTFDTSHRPFARPFSLHLF